MAKYDVYIVQFPYEENPEILKIRPSVEFDDDVVCKLVAKVTTKDKKYYNYTDVPLDDWKSEGLLQPSVLRLTKVALIDSDAYKKKVGHLTDADIQKVENALQKMSKKDESFVLDESLFDNQDCSVYKDSIKKFIKRNHWLNNEIRSDKNYED